MFEVKIQRLFFVVGLVFCSSSQAAELEKAEVSKIHPTQFAVGKKEVEIKEMILQKIIKQDKLKKYLKANPGIVIVGPGKVMYLIDGHHHASSLHMGGIEDIYVEIVKDWSDDTPAQFWEKMQDKKFVYLYDEAGKKKPYTDLPVRIEDLRDDPYRTIAWLVRKAKAFENQKVPFQEFEYAEFLRSRMSVDFSTEKAADDSLQKALDLVTSSDASHLPGYTGKRPTCDYSTLLKDLLKIED